MENSNTEDFNPGQSTLNDLIEQANYEHTITEEAKAKRREAYSTPEGMVKEINRRVTEMGQPAYVVLHPPTLKPFSVRQAAEDLKSISLQMTIAANRLIEAVDRQTQKGATPNE